MTFSCSYFSCYFDFVDFNVLLYIGLSVAFRFVFNQSIGFFCRFVLLKKSKDYLILFFCFFREEKHRFFLFLSKKRKDSLIFSFLFFC